MEHNEYLTTDDVAAEFNLRPGTLKAMRSRKMGPPYYRLGGGRIIRYRRSEVASWYQAHASGGAR